MCVTYERCGANLVVFYWPDVGGFFSCVYIEGTCGCDKICPSQPHATLDTLIHVPCAMGVIGVVWTAS